MKKKKMYIVQEKEKKSNVVYHLSSYEATMQQKPYLISASRASTYSKLDKAKKREDRKLEKKLKDYTKY